VHQVAAHIDDHVLRDDVGGIQHDPLRLGARGGVDDHQRVVRCRGSPLVERDIGPLPDLVHGQCDLGLADRDRAQRRPAVGVELQQGPAHAVGDPDPPVAGGDRDVDQPEPELRRPADRAGLRVQRGEHPPGQPGGVPEHDGPPAHPVGLDPQRYDRDGEPAQLGERRPVEHDEIADAVRVRRVGQRREAVRRVDQLARERDVNVHRVVRAVAELGVLHRQQARWRGLPDRCGRRRRGECGHGLGR